MREIKFRAWDNSDKEKPYMLGPYELSDSIFNNKEVRKLELMQYTGLKDKNGVEIYEGDIVELLGWSSQTKSDGYTFIEWDIDEIGWNFNRSQYAEDRYDFRKAIQNCLVIGNIHQNPELLNQ